MPGSTLKCLERCTSLELLKQAHAQILLSGLHHENYAAVKLVSFCSKALGNLCYARTIFNSLIGSANVFLWTAIITSYSNHESELTREAVLIYRIMLRDGPPPNHFTLSSVLKACSFLKAIMEGNQIHAYTTKVGFSSSTYVQAALLDMYAKFGWVLEARVVFASMSAGNVVACNSMMACYAKAGDIEAARKVFDRMSIRDTISWNTIISGYAADGNTLVAWNLFNQMPEKNINSWNALISGYSHSGEWNKAVNLFKGMLLDPVKPDHVTMAILMSACSQLGSPKIARQIHGFLKKNCIEMNCYVLNSLMDMYSKCGSASEAYLVFSEMPMKDVVSYNVMIASFANHGQGKNALKLFPKMLEKGLKPDTVTFLGILSACSHAGLLDAGRHYFDCMIRDHAIEPSVDHYACMIDLYGRAGYIEYAYDLVNTMPIEPHAGVWGALLNACRMHCHIKFGKIAARELFKSEPGNPGNYVLLSNMYARGHSWDAAAEARCLMRGNGVTKTVGCSWIDVDFEIHQFFTGQVTHPKLEDIYTVLKHLSSQLL
ncbi:pentatricopeptide repeat-containing protein At5g08510-like [Typha latifolia]|uniref:pentatricopeptide repeat-containing protein At5g08510-like n=1 Tax=Typha latifolia TaxID=4733 RepID=UPI003C2DC42E